MVTRLPSAGGLLRSTVNGSPSSELAHKFVIKLCQHVDLGAAGDLLRKADGWSLWKTILGLSWRTVAVCKSWSKKTSSAVIPTKLLVGILMNCFTALPSERITVLFWSFETRFVWLFYLQLTTCNLELIFCSFQPPIRYPPATVFKNPDPGSSPGWRT